MKKITFSIFCAAAILSLTCSATSSVFAADTFNVYGSATMNSGDSYSNVNVIDGELEINSGAKVGERKIFTGPGLLEGKWSDNGKEVPSETIGNLKTYDSIGTLIQTGDFSKTTNRGYIANAKVRGGTLDNYHEVDKMTVSGAGTRVNNYGDIGMFSTGYSNRYGGLTLESGIVTNRGYISIVDMSGGSLGNFDRVAEVYMSGGSVKNYDKIIYANVSAGTLTNVNYDKKGDGVLTGGAADTVFLSGSGVIINNNTVINLFMSGGEFKQLNDDGRNKVLVKAEISGGEFSGNGRVENMLLQNDAKLDTSKFTGKIDTLTFDETGGEVAFKVDSMGEVLSKLNLTNSFVDPINALISVYFDTAFLGDWTCFNLADLIDFGGVAKSVDWQSASYNFNMEDSSWGWLYEDNTKSGWIHSTSLSPEEIELLRQKLRQENFSSNPEPATVCALGLAFLLGIPAVRRCRRKSPN